MDNPLFRGISGSKLCINGRIPVPDRMFLRPSMDLVEVSAYMCRLRIGNGPLSVLIPLPVNGADICRAHQ